MKPILQALLLAERVYETKDRKKIIAGTFNRIELNRTHRKDVKTESGEMVRVFRQTQQMGSPDAFVSLTDVHDGTIVALQFVNVSKNKVLFQTEVAINCKDRLSTVEMIVPLPPPLMYLNEAGVYSFDVVWNGEILGSHRVIVADAGE